MGRFVLFTLVLAACGDTDSVGNDGNTNPGDSTSGSTTISGVVISANSGEYAFDADGIPTLVYSQEDVPYVAIEVLDEDANPVAIEDEDGNTLSETVAVVDNLEPGSYTTLFDYADEDGITMIGQVSSDISSTDREITANLGDDLSGGWHFVSDSGATEFDSDVVSDGSSLQIEGFLADEMAMTFNYASFSDEFTDFEVIYGRAADSIRVHMVLQGSSDVWYTGTREE